MTAKENAAFRCGTSGFQYDHWKGLFYPEDMPKKQWFEHYTNHFDTVEINNTFYNLPSAETFDKWREAAPEGFCYVLKFSRYGTHLKRLKDPQGTIGQFLENANHLGETLGPILVQLRPNWNVNPERLAAFLEAAPDDQRWAFEFRDPSWLCDNIYEILREHNAALCVHDMIPDHPDIVTADWIYRRFHGDDYSGCYSEEDLRRIADRVKEHLGENRDVYAYFNNDVGGHAVNNARDLREYVTATA